MELELLVEKGIKKFTSLFPEHRIVLTCPPNEYKLSFYIGEAKIPNDEKIIGIIYPNLHYDEEEIMINIEQFSNECEDNNFGVFFGNDIIIDHNDFIDEIKSEDIIFITKILNSKIIQNIIDTNSEMCKDEIKEQEFKNLCINISLSELYYLANSKKYIKSIISTCWSAYKLNLNNIIPLLLNNLKKKELNILETIAIEKILKLSKNIKK